MASLFRLRLSGVKGVIFRSYGVKELRHVFGGVGCDKKRKSLRRKRPVLLDIKTNF